MQCSGTALQAFPIRKKTRPAGMIPTGRNHACKQYMHRGYNGSVLCAAAYAWFSDDTTTCSNSRPTSHGDKLSPWSGRSATAHHLLKKGKIFPLFCGGGVPANNVVKFTTFLGHQATARQLGDLRRAQPTVYRKGGKFFRLFWACCAASEKEDNLTSFTAGTEVRPTEVKLTSLSPFGGARDLTLFTCPLFTCPYTENKVKLTLFSGHHAPARQLSATTAACVALLRMPAQTRAPAIGGLWGKTYPRGGI